MLTEFYPSNPAHAVPHALLQSFAHVRAHPHTSTHICSTSAESHTGQRVAKATGAQQPVYISGDEIILFFSLAAFIALSSTPPPLLHYSE